MYSPKIKEDLVKRLYQFKQSKRVKRPMTFYVNEAIEKYLEQEKKKVNSR